MSVARHVRVAGLVQGVFFRAWTQEEAEQLGVKGWVRNCPDGSVEGHLEGIENSVNQLIERMRSGPSGAQVDEISFEEVQPEGMRSFEVRRA